MKKILFSITFLLLLAACTSSNKLTLSAEMKEAMQARADEYAQQYPADMNIAQMCVDKPIALYWNAGLQTYAVVCEYPLPNVYGVLLIDINNVVLNTQHINATSMDDLEGIIGSMGWERTQ